MKLQVGVWPTWYQADRLGSHGQHHPYGEQRSGTTWQDPGFATYWRESSGLDYAVNRHYSATYGRFTSADPYRASGGPADPGSWNRYGYVEGDPVNFNDAPGLFAQSVGQGPVIYIPPPPSLTGGGGSWNVGGPEVPQLEVPPEGIPRLADLIHVAVGLIRGWTTALSALDNDDCASAIGAENGEVAKARLGTTPINNIYLGSPTIKPLSNGGASVSNVLVAKTDGYTISVNADLFFFPSHALGSSGVTMLQLAALEWGIAKPLSTEVYQATYLLHELGHILNGFGNDLNSPDESKRYSRSVVENCFKGLTFQ